MSQPRDPADIEWLKRWNIGSAEALFRDTWFGDDQLTRLNASLLEALLVRRHPMTLDILKAKVPPLVVEGLIAKLSGPLPSSVGDVRAGGRSCAGTNQGRTTAEAARQWSQRRSVLCLKDKGRTIGTACCIQLGTGHVLLLAARDSLAGPAGTPIAMAGITAGGRPVRHIVSFPQHGISVLQLEDGELPGGLNPFRLAGDAGLFRSMDVTLITYPLEPDESLPDGTPGVLHGTVVWTSHRATLAAADYQGTMPTCGGGAVALTPRLLAGIHLGAIGHEEEHQRPGSPDAQTWEQHPLKRKRSEVEHPPDSPDAQAWEQHRQHAHSPAPAAAGGVLDASRSLFVEISLETRVWSAPPSTSGGSGCGPMAHQADGADRMDSNSLKPAVDRCATNVQHTGGPGPGYFVPASTLCALLCKPEVQRLIVGSRPGGQSGVV